MERSNESHPAGTSARPDAGWPQSIWWTVQHAEVWQSVEPSLRNEYERRRADRYREQIKKQGPDNAVFRAGDEAPRTIDVDHAYQVGDANWELDGDWDDVSPALRFGLGARLHHAGMSVWSDELEQSLKAEWIKRHDPSAWEKLKRAVRRGFDFKRGD